jgi:hypothetical protein
MNVLGETISGAQNALTKGGREVPTRVTKSSACVVDADRGKAEG